MDIQKFKDFYDALAHGYVDGSGMNRFVFFECRINTARAVVEYKLNDHQPETFDVENTPGEHAEVVALQKLTQKIIQEHTATGQNVEVEVKIYINFSPCHNCSEQLLQFMTLPQAENVRMTIIIAALYDILRKSCLESCITDGLCRKHVQFFFDRRRPLDSLTNKLGLRFLKASGVTLRSFKIMDWLFLSKYLFRGNHLWEIAVMNWNNPTYVQLEEKLNQQYPKKIQITGTQREQEDERQLKDQNDIFSEAEVTARRGQQPLTFSYPNGEAVLNPSVTWGKMKYNVAGLPSAIPERIALPAPKYTDASTTDPNGVHHPRLQVNAVIQADAGEYFCAAELEDEDGESYWVSSNTVKLRVVG